MAKKFKAMKASTRPFVCVKLYGQNWLIPLSSINPRGKKYQEKLHKQKQFDYADNLNKPKAMDFCGDILQTEIKGFQSVAQYYSAIPVKHKYVRKYRNKSQDHLIVDEGIGKKLRSHLAKYLRTVKEHKLTGFIGKYASEGHKRIASYPIDCMGLYRALYKDYLKQRKVQRQKRDQAQQRAEEKQRKKELRQTVRQQTAVSSTQPMNREQQIAALISVCGQRIANEINRDQARARQAEQARQAQPAGQVKPIGANMPKGRAKGKAPRGK